MLAAGGFDVVDITLPTLLHPKTAIAALKAGYHVRQFLRAGRVFFERATVCFGPFYKAPLTVYPEAGKPFSPKLPSKTGYEAEIEYFLGMVEGRKQKRILTAQDARDSIALLVAERRSDKSGKCVRL